MRRDIAGFASDAMDALVSYSWPGNIRDLENAVETAIIIGKSETIRLEDLPKRITQKKPLQTPIDFKNLATEAKRAAILQRREETGETFGQIARWFGVSKQWVYKLLGPSFTDSVDLQ